MKRMIVFGLVLFTSLASVAWGQWTQLPTAKEPALRGKPVYYDTFDQQWLNPTKWLATGPFCRGLECVREIQNGHLRLEVRSFGATDSNSGLQSSESELDFANPNAISSITADVVLRSFSGTGCSTNNTEGTFTRVQIGGYYFNTGTGDSADDVTSLLILSVDTTDPKTVKVSAFWYVSGQGGWTDIDSYPIGTPLTGTLAWDKANHQFIAVVKARGEPGPGKEVMLPYSISDTTPAVSPRRTIDAVVWSSNCTSTQTYAQVEAFYDNVLINSYPLPSK